MGSSKTRRTISWPSNLVANVRSGGIFRNLPGGRAGMLCSDAGFGGGSGGGFGVGAAGGARGLRSSLGGGDEIIDLENDNDYGD